MSAAGTQQWAFFATFEWLAGTPAPFLTQPHTPTAAEVSSQPTLICAVQIPSLPALCCLEHKRSTPFCLPFLFPKSILHMYLHAQPEAPSEL